MPVFVKSYRRGRSVVKAYSRNLEHARVLNMRFKTVRGVKTFGGSDVAHAAHNRLNIKLTKSGLRSRKHLAALTQKYKVAAKAFGRPTDDRSINLFLSRVFNRARNR